MKQNIFSLTIVLVLSLLVAPMQAETETLTIDECRTLALQHNKDRQSAALTTQQMLYTQKATHALFFPDLSLMGIGIYDTGKGTQSLDFNSALSAMIQPHSALIGQLATLAAQKGIDVSPLMGTKVPDYNVDYKVGWLFSGGVVLKQPLYMGGKIRAAYAMSKTAVQLARENERLSDAQVIQQVDEAYALVVKAEELMQVAGAYCTLLEELDRNVESAVRLGMRMPNDRMKVQVKLNEVELQQRRAENAVRLAKMNLSHLIGSPLGGDITVEHSFPAVTDAVELQTLDVSLRPELAMLDAQTEIANQQVKIARSAMLPQVALLAKYGYTNGLEINDRTLLDGFNFAGGVTVSVPLYHFGEQQNKLKAAKVKQQQTQLERENKQELMLLELTRAANTLDEARLEVQLAEKSLSQAETSMHMSKQQYDAGFETLSDYLESQAQWQKANETLVTARYQQHLASVAYLKAAGLLVR